MKILKTILFSICFCSMGSFNQTSVDMPNVITPNNDGVNDIFTIRTTGFEELTCTIYNRHGAVVYRFFGLNGSWDGFTHAGIKASPGVYFVILEVSTSDGTNETRQGTLELMY